MRLRVYGPCPAVGVARSPTGPLPTTWNQSFATRPVNVSRATRSPVPPAQRKSEAHQIAEDAGAAFRLIECVCSDPARHRSRIEERIRGIPEVLDTSTLVPEYSVTKFP